MCTPRARVFLFPFFFLLAYSFVPSFISRASPRRRNVALGSVRLRARGKVTELTERLPAVRGVRASFSVNSFSRRECFCVYGIPLTPLFRRRMRHTPFPKWRERSFYVVISFFSFIYITSFYNLFVAGALRSSRHELARPGEKNCCSFFLYFGAKNAHSTP